MKRDWLNILSAATLTVVVALSFGTFRILRSSQRARPGLHVHVMEIRASGPGYARRWGVILARQGQRYGQYPGDLGWRDFKTTAWAIGVKSVFTYA